MAIADIVRPESMLLGVSSSMVQPVYILVNMSFASPDGVRTMDFFLTTRLTLQEAWTGNFELLVPKHMLSKVTCLVS